MKIPEYMLPDKCIVTPFDASTPSGDTYLTPSSSKSCRYERKRKWSTNQSKADNAQFVYYIELFFNYSSDLPEVPIGSLIQVEGETVSYTVVDFKKMGGFNNCHWELVLQ